MAVLTAATRLDTIFGNMRVMFVTFTAVADADTFATGLNKVNLVSSEPATSAAMGYTVSGGTVTFKVSAGSPAVATMIIGT